LKNARPANELKKAGPENAGLKYAEPENVGPENAGLESART